MNLTYFFSTGSRYSYLSMARIPSLEVRYGVKFDWVPVNGKRIRALLGRDPFAGPPQSGQYDWGYRERDAKAWAKLYGVVFNEPRDVEFDVECLLRGVIAAGRQGDVRSFAWALAQCVFADGAWPLDQTVVDGVAAAHDLDMARFADDCADPQTQLELERNCAAAVERGAFGTPTFFVDEELYWGNDRLPLVERRLQEMLGSNATCQVTGLDHVVLRAPDPQALVEFYQALLACEVERVVGDFLWQLRIGDSLLDIMRGERGGLNMDHFCLRTTAFDAQALLARLGELGAEGELAERPYGAQGYGPSLYFRDPLGNTVELKADLGVV